MLFHDGPVQIQSNEICYTISREKVAMPVAMISINQNFKKINTVSISFFSNDNE